MNSFQTAFYLAFFFPLQLRLRILVLSQLLHLQSLYQVIAVSLLLFLANVLCIALSFSFANLLSLFTKSLSGLGDLYDTSMGRLVTVAMEN